MNWYMDWNDPPKSMPKRETAALIEELKEIRRIATMDDMNLFVFDKEAEAKNAEIKEITKAYRESWLIAPLDRLIERYSKLLGEQNG